MGGGGAPPVMVVAGWSKGDRGASSLTMLVEDGVAGVARRHVANGRGERRGCTVSPSRDRSCDKATQP